MVSLLLLVACGQDFRVNREVPEPEAPSPTPPAVTELDPAHLLLRLSLDLRGVRPSLAEIAAVEEDPAAMDAAVEDFLRDARFGERVRSLFADVYLTRQDAWYVSASDFGMDDEPGFAAAVGDEPLRLLSTVAEEDLPYTDLVTADWTVADEHLGAAWPVDYPEGESGWRVVHYTDGRPAAGVLATNGFWWRFMSSFSNANRGRANAVSRTFLCEDYLSKPITFDRSVNILDGAALGDALANNPGCAACHYSLDPLAAYLWGFFFYDYTSAADTTVYHPERERLWEDYANGVGPGYYGATGYSVADLGKQIADDPRFVSCGVQRVWEGLLQRPMSLEDTGPLLTHRAAFTDDGLRLRSLFRSVVGAPEYRSDDGTDPRVASRKLVSPDLLASSVEDLTGFRFSYRGYDMLSTDSYGLRTLAGGVDGQFVTSPARAPTATLLLVQERLAEAAAAHVTDEDRARPDAARLFTVTRFTETPTTDRDTMARQVQELHLRIFADHVDLDGPEVEANLSLWQELYDLDHDPVAAWAGVLTALLRDPYFLVY